jgi:tRNA nucleotidyltransferase (CCA-adding enzyme)
MEILATHINADFDALAAMVAASRLHPEARMFFPGSREESVRRMLESGLVEISELKRKDVDPAGLTRVILCDVRQRDRIGIVGEWLAEHPGIEVWAYDHHPAAESDVPVAGGIVDPEAGSTSTLICEETQRRELVCTATEANLLLLGIYEDTGSLTHATTGRRDLAAVLWLLDQGGDLGVVRRFVTRELGARHLDILHRMTQRLEAHRIRGHRVGLVELDLDGYVEELAPLVSRCLEIFELPLLFALFSEAENDRVTLIARGDLPGFDLGQALAEMAGGGGHATAAAARLRGQTTLEAREQLFAFLRRALPPSARARDLMIAPFFELPATTPVDEAKARLNAWRVTAAPVFDQDRVLGVVTRTLLDAAIQHGLGDRPIERVTATELVWVDPETPAEEVEERMLARRPRFVLVGDPESGRPLGLITRMQILRHLHGRLTAFEERLDRRAEQQREKREKIAQLLSRRLPAPLERRIETIAQVSREAGVPVYLVGGFVRDLLLERDFLRDQRDLDLVVEGDGIAFAARLAEAVGGRKREHRAFLTAVVVDPEGLHIDVATARSEFYRAPAALPEVRMSALRQDLFRRDFTINTLAIRLGPGPVPELIDYFGGRSDLKEKTLRVLHSLSFIDDPTRVLRAVRLELRLGFHISTETLRLVEVALAEGIFDHLSGARLREELEMLLDDPALALRGIDRLAELGILRVLHPQLELADLTRERLRAARAACDWYQLAGLADPPVRPWRLILLALAQDLDPAGRERLAGRLLLAGEDRRLLTGFVERIAVARHALRGALPGALPETLPPHRAAEALEPLAGEELLLLMAEGDDAVRAWVRRDLTELRRLRLAVRGGDLIAAGVPRGPGIGRALQAVRRARLDGLLSESDELGYALAFLRTPP